MTKSGRRQREREAHRVEIMDAAEDLFAAKGFAGVGMREVARRAEFALGTIYRFFGSKEDLYVQILKRRLGALRKAVDAAVAEHADSIKRLDAFIEAKVRFLADNAPFLRLYFSELKGAGASNIRAVAAPVKSTCSRLLEKLTGLLEALRKQHGPNGFDPHEMALALDGATDGFLLSTLHDRTGRKSAGDIAQAVKRAFFGRLG